MEKRHSSFSVAFPIASVWFGALVGPSMVSGAFAVVYFMPYGMWGLLLPFISMGVASVIVSCGLFGVKLWSVENYSDYGKKLYGKYAWLFSPLLEFYLILAMIVGGSSVIAMGGTFFHDLLGIAPFWGQLLMAVISSVLVLWGAELVRKSSTCMTIILLLGFACMIGISCYYGHSALVQQMKSWYVPEGKTFWMGVGPAVALGLSNACNALTLSSVSQKLRTTKDVLITGLCAFTLNSFMFIGCVIFLLPYMPTILLEDVPNLYVIKQYLATMVPWLPAVYNIVMLLGLASSGAPQLNAVAYRVVNLYPNKGIFQKTTNRNVCTAVIYMTICILVSSLGLRTIIGKGYSLLGFLSIPLIVIPLCVILPLRVYRKK